MCVLAPGANVLLHLEEIGEDLLRADTTIIHLHDAGAPAGEILQVRSNALDKTRRALDGAYDLDAHTVALLRVLEAACTLTQDLDLELASKTSQHLRAARRDLQLALFMRLRRQHA